MAYCLIKKIIFFMVWCFIKQRIRLHGGVTKQIIVFTAWCLIMQRIRLHGVVGRSNIGIAGSNPPQGMDVCLCCVVLCR
jgi:hypothetical protein